MCVRGLQTVDVTFAYAPTYGFENDVHDFITTLTDPVSEKDVLELHVSTRPGFAHAST
jgi:hypothetical protein